MLMENVLQYDRHCCLCAEYFSSGPVSIHPSQDPLVRFGREAEIQDRVGTLKFTSFWRGVMANRRLG